MLEWFKRKAMEKSRENIIALIDELIPVANTVAINIERNLTPNSRDRIAVHKLQDQLLIQLCGPIPLDQVKREIIDPAMAKPNVSSGARMAILHAYNTAIGTSKTTNVDSVTVKAGTMDNEFDEFETTFFRGKIRFRGGDEQLSHFELADGSARIAVPNDIHVRLIEQIKMPPVFEIVAPMTHVIVEEGIVPASYQVRARHSYYIELEEHFVPLQLANAETRMRPDGTIRTGCLPVVGFLIIVIAVKLLMH